MVDHDAFQDTVEEFTEALLQPYDIGDLLYRLTDRVVEVLDLDGAGVSLARTGGSLAFVTASDRRSATIEEQQVAEQEGPCQVAFRDGRAVHVADLRDHCPWPDYGPAALARGVRAVAGLPIPVDAPRIGAMDLYRARPGPWTTQELRIAQVLANLAAGHVRKDMELSRSRSLATQLQEALDSRVAIEQAKGILAGRHGLSPDGAFDLLRRHARRTSQRLHHVCARVLAGDLDLPDLLGDDGASRT